MEYRLHPRLHPADKRSPISRRAKARTGPCIALFVTLVSGSAIGQQMQITPGDCTTGVHLVAREAPLVEVLKRLSRALDFELRFEGDKSRLVTVNVTRPPVELVSTLAPQDSVIVTQARDPRCAGRNRIVKVWVLPQGAEATTRDAALPPSARTAKSADRPEQIIRPSAQLEEQSRRAKQAYDEYVRVHGKAPPGVEEEAAKP
jgi:hypothetical protein